MVLDLKKDTVKKTLYNISVIIKNQEACWFSIRFVLLKIFWSRITKNIVGPFHVLTCNVKSYL